MFIVSTYMHNIYIHVFAHVHIYIYTYCVPKIDLDFCAPWRRISVSQTRPGPGGFKLSWGRQLKFET